MSDKKYITITELGAIFGMTRVEMGRKLKQLRLRERNGDPSAVAFHLEMVAKTTGPQSWITLWLWHADWTVRYLEHAGLRRLDHVSV